MNAKALPFTLTVDGASSDEAGWFGSGQSGDMVVLAPVHGLPDHPRTVILAWRGQGAVRDAMV
jgi:hypothetical protein